MRDDRPPLHPAIWAETPTGRIWEMEVTLDRNELLPAPGYRLEPWVRVTMSDDWQLAAGIEVTRQEDDA